MYSANIVTKTLTNTIFTLIAKVFVQVFGTRCSYTRGWPRYDGAALGTAIVRVFVKVLVKVLVQVFMNMFGNVFVKLFV